MLWPDCSRILLQQEFARTCRSNDFQLPKAHDHSSPAALALSMEPTGCALYTQPCKLWSAPFAGKSAWQAVYCNSASVPGQGAIITERHACQLHLAFHVHAWCKLCCWPNNLQNLCGTTYVQRFLSTLSSAELHRLAHDAGLGKVHMVSCCLLITCTAEATLLQGASRSAEQPAMSTVPKD